MAKSKKHPNSYVAGVCVKADAPDYFESLIKAGLGRLLNHEAFLGWGYDERFKKGICEGSFDDFLGKIDKVMTDNNYEFKGRSGWQIIERDDDGNIISRGDANPKDLVEKLREAYTPKKVEVKVSKGKSKRRKERSALESALKELTAIADDLEISELKNRDSRNQLSGLASDKLPRYTTLDHYVNNVEHLAKKSPQTAVEFINRGNLRTLCGRLNASGVRQYLNALLRAEKAYHAAENLHQNPPQGENVPTPEELKKAKDNAYATYNGLFNIANNGHDLFVELANKASKSSRNWRYGIGAAVTTAVFGAYALIGGNGGEDTAPAESALTTKQMSDCNDLSAIAGNDLKKTKATLEEAVARRNVVEATNTRELREALNEYTCRYGDVEFVPYFFWRGDPPQSKIDLLREVGMVRGSVAWSPDEGYKCE